MTQNRLRSISSVAAPDEVRRELDKLLGSRWFVRSGRMRRFLRFGVEHALAGTASEIKEYLVGMEVFDRGADYDPQVDPIVRVEARRLRAKLEAYYASTGKNDALVIEFPKGTYKATFRARIETQHVESRETSPTTITVLPFISLSPIPGQDYFGDGLTEELITLLMRVQGLRVLACQPTSQSCKCERDAGSVGEKPRAGAILRGSCRHACARVRVTAQLIDAESRAYLWSEVFERNTADVIGVQEEVARMIVDRLTPRLGRSYIPERSAFERIRN